MWPQEAELLFGPYTSLCMEDAGDMERKGLKRFIKLRVSISTNRPSLEGLDLDDCAAIPLWVSSMDQLSIASNKYATRYIRHDYASPISVCLQHTRRISLA
jgi:hypothetical protein